MPRKRSRGKSRRRGIHRLFAAVTVSCMADTSYIVCCPPLRQCKLSEEDEATITKSSRSVSSYLNEGPPDYHGTSSIYVGSHCQEVRMFKNRNEDNEEGILCMISFLVEGVQVAV